MSQDEEKSPFNIVTSSPQALQSKGEPDKTAYPFDSLAVGQSFTAQIKEVNWKSIRTSVYQRNSRSKDGRQFKFIKHDDLGVVEVARIA